MNVTPLPPCSAEIQRYARTHQPKEECVVPQASQGMVAMYITTVVASVRTAVEMS